MKLKKRLMNLPLSVILLFILVNTFFLFYFGNIIIRVLFFIVSTIILFFFGKLPFLDPDPMPFSTGVMFLFFGFPIAAQYAIWSIPAGDAISARFNQWSFVNLFSVLSSLILVSLLKLNPMITLVLLILVFNIIRFLIAFFTGNTLGAIISASTNTIIYLIIISMSLPLIQIGIALFK